MSKREITGGRRRKIANSRKCRKLLRQEKALEEVNAVVIEAKASIKYPNMKELKKNASKLKLWPASSVCF